MPLTPSTQTSSNVTAGNDAKASDFNKAVADLTAIFAGIIVSGNWGIVGALTLGGALFNSSATTATGSGTGPYTVTPTAGLTNFYTVTALAGAATIAAPTGSPADGQILTIRIKDNGTARALTWDATYRVIGCVLPTATTTNKNVYVACRYNAVDGFWDVLGVGQQ